MIYFLLLTAFTVSIDSFVCGFSLSLGGGRKLPILFGIFLTVLAMCLFTNYAALLFAGKVTERTASLGGLILIGVGIFNLCKKNKEQSTGSGIRQVLVSGFAVGLDGAMANLSLSLMGLNALYVPVIIALMHFVMIGLGVYLAGSRWLQKVSKISFIAPLILILLGVYKLIGFFL